MVNVEQRLVLSEFSRTRDRNNNHRKSPFLATCEFGEKSSKSFGIQEFWSTRAMPLTGLATFRSRQLRKQVEAWPRCELADVTAKVFIYEAFVGGKLEAPKHFARTVHDLYFEPKYEDFRSRTIWSLSNAFTSAFKELVTQSRNSGRRRS